MLLTATAESSGRVWPRSAGLANRRVDPGGSKSRRSSEWRAKKSGPPCGSPDDQAYLRVPSIPSVAWQPYPSPLGRLRAHSLASPPHDGFAFIEDGANRPSLTGKKLVAGHIRKIGRE